MTTMTKKRVAELEGAQLDWAVMLALGYRRYSGPWWSKAGAEMLHEVRFAPSSDWIWGGQIIDKLISSGEFQITPWHYKGDDPVLVSNTNSDSRPVKPENWSQTNIDAFGPDVLTAASRAFVMWKLGDEVDVPARDVLSKLESH